MSKTLALVLSTLFSLPAFGGTALSIGMQSGAPVQIVQALHGIPDLLLSAQFENRGDKEITGYRIGWVSVSSGKAKFQSGPWMALPAGAKPGTSIVIPAQNIQPKAMPDQMTFFVSEIGRAHV